MRFALKIPATVLMIFQFAALGNVYAQAPTQPTLPQKTVSLTLPTQGISTCPTLTTGSNCIRNVPSGNATSFQNAINAATCGDTIVLVAGSSYSGNFTIPSTSCSGWIEIVSSNLSSLPSPGNRVGPSNVSNMATISTPNTSPALQFQASSNHWRLMGVEITTSVVDTVNTVYNLVISGFTGGGADITVQAQLPDNLIFDRSYIHGLSNTNTTRGILMNTQAVAVVDSYCDEIHYNGNDSQCFMSYNGSGPFLIQNNFIQAAGENIMFGGADPAITNLVPSDITIVGNLIQKNQTWRGQAAPLNWSVKNLFELKNAQRVLLDGNVLQYTWLAAQAEAMIWRSVNQNGTCTWCVVQDVTATHNLVRHAPAGLVLAPIQGPVSTNNAIVTQRILLQNNVLADISATNWGASGWLYEVESDSTLPTMHDVIIDHNTGFEDQMVLRLGNSGQVSSVKFTNNISDYGVSGIWGNAVGSGTVALTTFLSPYTYNDIFFLNTTGTNPGTTYPSGTFWGTQTNVGFTNYSGGNFQLLNTSAYHNAGTDGKDIGVWDWTCLNNDSTAALAGTFVPSPGCALSVNLSPQPPTNLTVIIQ